MSGHALRFWLVVWHLLARGCGAAGQQHGSEVADWVRSRAHSHTQREVDPGLEPGGLSAASRAEVSVSAAAVDAYVAGLASEYAPLDLRASATQAMACGAACSRELQRKLRAVVRGERPSFSVAVGGHSVCAGHGNYFNESYAAVLDRLLIAGFKKAGLSARSFNFGMGGTGALPFGWCMRDMVGDDADVVAWDYNMLEGKTWQISEVFARAAFRLSSRPLALWMVDPSDPRAKMLRQYVAHDRAFATMPALDHLAKALPAVSKAARSPSAPDALRDILFAPQGGDERQKSRKFRTPNGAPGRTPWHPGWRLHRLQGALLAVWLLTELRDALLAEDAATTRENNTTAALPLAGAPLAAELPEPSARACGQALLCKRALYHCATTYAPRVGRDLAQLSHKAWPVVLARGDPAQRAEELGLGYLDRKWTLQGDSTLPPLRLQLDDALDGEIVLCEASTGWRRPLELGDLGADVALFALDDPRKPWRRLSLSRNKLVPLCYHARFNARITHSVPIAINVSTPGKSVYLSHVIWG